MGKILVSAATVIAAALGIEVIKISRFQKIHVISIVVTFPLALFVLLDLYFAFCYIFANVVQAHLAN